MLKKIKPFFILIAIFFAGCSSKEEIPSDVLPKEKMIPILTDMQEAEAIIQASGFESSDSTKQIAYGYYKYIFQKHNVTPELFKKSFDYYSQHLDLLDHMYDEVLTNLSKNQATAAGKH